MQLIVAHGNGRCTYGSEHSFIAVETPQGLHVVVQCTGGDKCGQVFSREQDSRQVGAIE